MAFVVMVLVHETRLSRVVPRSDVPLGWADGLGRFTPKAQAMQAELADSRADGDGRQPDRAQAPSRARRARPKDQPA